MFPLVSKFSACNLIVVFCEKKNKYFVNHGCGLWMYFTESWEKRKLKTLLCWIKLMWQSDFIISSLMTACNCKYCFLYFLEVACINSESWEDQYMFIFCPVEDLYSWTLFSDVSVFKPIYSMHLLGNIPIIVVSNWKRPVCESYWIIQSPDMPKSNKTSPCKMENNPSQDEASTHDESGCHQEQDQKVIWNQPHVQQVAPSIFMPYIEGPKMDWIVNDGLYQRFLKWRLKCKKDIGVWACNACGEKKMQEGACLE